MAVTPATYSGFFILPSILKEIYPGLYKLRKYLKRFYVLGAHKVSLVYLIIVPVKLIGQTACLGAASSVSAPSA